MVLAKSQFTACENGAGKKSVYGAQLIIGLWRVFCQTGGARTNLLMAGLTVRRLAMRFYDKKPYSAVDGDDGQVSTTKLIISDLPMYMSEPEVEEALFRLNVDIKSKIMHVLARDEKGKFSRFTTICILAYHPISPPPIRPISHTHTHTQKQQILGSINGQAVFFLFPWKCSWEMSIYLISSKI